jgi:Tfp pilus assembly protein FimV
MKYFVILIILLTPAAFYAESSQHIEVYAVNQAYWDVQRGETLGQIINKLLPHNREKHAALFDEIVQLNPDAFINADANAMKANVRLWLPGHTQGLNRKVNKDKYTIKEFSWGYIQQAK